MFLVEGKPRPELSRWGGLSVAVPGEVRGYQALHKRWGKRPWRELFQPAARAAESGLEVTEFLTFLLHAVEKPLRRYTEMKRLYLKDGRMLEVGDRILNPDLARLFEELGEKGADWFYQGELAQEIVRTVQATGGILDLEDLASYRPLWRKPVTGNFRGYQVVSMPPPSSGGVILLEILQVLNHFPLEQMGLNSSAYLHTLAEALKHGFADRAEYMGDPAKVRVPVSHMLSPAYARSIARKIHPLCTREMERYRHQIPEDHGTNHFCVVDSAGNVVAATATINYAFGSLVVVPGRGFVLNNEMDDFSINPGVPNAFGLVGGEANAAAAGKKPLSSMTPTIVLRDGKPVLALGGGGGPRIITGTLQTLLNVLVFHQDVQQALDSPRIHHQWSPDLLYCEDSLSLDVLRSLGQRGHRVEVSRSLNNRVQAVRILADHLEAASDPREQGAPAGY
jgi:gamma-glutamyltranspeptidase/glutathione hydrolase